MNLSPAEVLQVAAISDIYDVDLPEVLETKLDNASPRDVEEALRAARNIPQLRSALVLATWVDEVTYLTRQNREPVCRTLRANAENRMRSLLGSLEQACSVVLYYYWLIARLMPKTIWYRYRY